MEVELSDSEGMHNSFTECLRGKSGDSKKGKEPIVFTGRVASSKMGPKKMDEHDVVEALNITGSATKLVAHGFTDLAIVGKLMELVASLSARRFDGGSRQAHVDACLQNLASLRESEL